MKKMKSADRNKELPEPVALTADQIKQIAGTTAGGVTTLPLAVHIIAGGIPAHPPLT